MKTLIIGIILCIIILFIVKMYYNSRLKNNFKNISVYEKNKTLLYGSLFLDKLNEQIKNMTDPKIIYDNKRIDIIKYSDILL